MILLIPAWRSLKALVKQTWCCPSSLFFFKWVNFSFSQSSLTLDSCWFPWVLLSHRQSLVRLEGKQDKLMLVPDLSSQDQHSCKSLSCYTHTSSCPLLVRVRDFERYFRLLPFFLPSFVNHEGIPTVQHLVSKKVYQTNNEEECKEAAFILWSLLTKRHEESRPLNTLFFADSSKNDDKNHFVVRWKPEEQLRLSWDLRPYFTAGFNHQTNILTAVNREQENWKMSRSVFDNLCSSPCVLHVPRHPETHEASTSFSSTFYGLFVINYFCSFSFCYTSFSEK